MGGELPWPFWYFDAYIRSWRYLHPRTVGMEMLMGITVFYGAICFVVGSFSDSSPWWPPLDDEHRERWWLVYVTFFVGSYLFTTSCALQTVLGVNQDWDARISQWKVSGGDKPRLRMIELRPINLFWLSGCVYTFGCVLYNIGTTFSMVSTLPGMSYPPSAYVGAGQLTFVVGGVCFLVAGFLLVLEREKSRWFIGLFIPPRKEDWASLDFWVNWFNWWGGVGFCLSGPFLLFPNIDIRTYRTENFFGFGLGSVCFLLVGILVCVKLSVARYQQVQDIGGSSSTGAASTDDLLRKEARSHSQEPAGRQEMARARNAASLV